MRSLGRISALSCVLAFGLWLFAAQVEAQDARARARTSFNEGVAHYEAGRYREALAAFEQAYRAAPHPSVRVNMANCFEQLGQYSEALFNFRRYLEESAEDVEPATRAEIELTIARLEARIGKVLIDVDPSNAKLTIDGKEPKRLPGGGVQLAAGTHTLRATAPGYEPMERVIEVEGATEQRVSLLLSRESSEALPSIAQAESPAYEGVDPRIDPELVEPPPEESSVRGPLLWAAAGTTAVFATGFAVSGGLAIKSQNDFDRAVSRSNDPTLDPAVRERARSDGLEAADQADLRAMLSDIFLAGTVVGVGATVLIYFTTKKPEERRSASFNAGPMMLRRGGGGVAIGGKF